MFSESRANASPSEADEDLLIRLRAGDCHAFREAVERYQPKMIGAARRIVGQSQAEDVVQDAWMSALKSLDAFEGRAALATWLVRITTNKAISHLRSRSRELEHGCEDVEPHPGDGPGGRARGTAPFTQGDASSPDEMLSAVVLLGCIDKHLACMPARQRSVVVMHDLEQRTISDICNELGLSLSNARVLLHRGRSTLLNMTNGYQRTGIC